MVSVTFVHVESEMFAYFCLHKQLKLHDSQMDLAWMGNGNVLIFNHYVVVLTVYLG